MKNSVNDNVAISQAVLKHSQSFSELAKALIQFSALDGNHAAEKLSHSLATLQTQIATIELKLKSSINAEELQQNIDIMKDELFKAIIELQFFDRVSQRLTHAVSSVEAIHDPVRTLEDIRKQFTMEDERILFSALESGEGVDEAVQNANNMLNNVVAKTDGDDIELF